MGYGTNEHVTIRTDNPELSAQLSSVTKYENQTDFIDLVKRNMQFNALQFKVISATDKSFEVSLKHGNGRHVAYKFSKNITTTPPPDDYILLNEGYVGASTLNLRKNYDSTTGTFQTGFPPNYYTQQVGATMTAAFTGTGIDFSGLCDNRGGVWRFVVDGADSIDISTYTALAGYVKTRSLFKDLPYGNHTVVGTFQGDDPQHVPSGGAGTSRGWLSFGSDTLSTFNVYQGISQNTNEQSILYSTSNKEFAINALKLGSGSTGQFFPTHGVPTAVKTSAEQIFVDGKLIDLASVTNIEGAKSFKLVQNVNFVHSDFPANPLLKLTSILTINLNGVVELSCKATFLEDTFIPYGYVCMCPVPTPFTKKMVTSLRNTIPTILTNGSRTNLVEEGDGASSFIFLNDTLKQYGIAMRLNDIKSTLRQGFSDKYSSTVWIEHRDTLVQKLYPQIFLNSTFHVGDTLEWSASYCVAEIPNLHDIV